VANKGGITHENHVNAGCLFDDAGICFCAGAQGFEWKVDGEGVVGRGCAGGEGAEVLGGLQKPEQEGICCRSVAGFF
jgi:hypothetical protein